MENGKFDFEGKQEYSHNGKTCHLKLRHGQSLSVFGPDNQTL